MLVSRPSFAPATRLPARSFFSLLAWLGCALVLQGCGFNTVIDRDEDVKATWAEVQNQYKRRADLVPSLVKVVKGAADFEQKTLKQVVEARAKVASMQVDSSLVDNLSKLRAFERAQQKLSGALSRLMVVVERYPNLKASANYRDLQAQLEGTENRIAVARRRYIESIAAYNKVVQRFPSMIGAKLRGKDVRPTLEVEPGLDKAPDIKL
ncbi:MAG: LemA family protein [Polyangiales bacterium]